jgi:hypothetical protein
MYFRGCRLRNGLAADRIKKWRTNPARKPARATSSRDRVIQCNRPSGCCPRPRSDSPCAVTFANCSACLRVFARRCGGSFHRGHRTRGQSGRVGGTSLRWRQGTDSRSAWRHDGGPAPDHNRSWRGSSSQSGHRGITWRTRRNDDHRWTTDSASCLERQSVSRGGWTWNRSSRRRRLARDGGKRWREFW